MSNFTSSRNLLNKEFEDLKTENEQGLKKLQDLENLLKKKT